MAGKLIDVAMYDKRKWYPRKSQNKLSIRCHLHEAEIRLGKLFSKGLIDAEVCGWNRPRNRDQFLKRRTPASPALQYCEARHSAGAASTRNSPALDSHHRRRPSDIANHGVERIRSTLRGGLSPRQGRLRHASCFVCARRFSEAPPSISAPSVGVHGEDFEAWPHSCVC